MAQDTGGLVGRQLEVLWTTGTLTGLSDAQLLSRFTGVKDATAESAFRELVNRHGPMVMGVCRQILRRGQDAEDAFQATFLILVRKAHTVQVRESLAPWLYSVAYRTAQRARSAGSRYRQGEAGQLEALGAAPEDFSRLDLRPLLHEELGRLPNKYRAPIVLCHLEGKTHEEAARMLHWPVGTVNGRLSRGRQLLKSRLERRGLSVPSAIFAASGWNMVEPIPLSMVESTLTAATRFATRQSVSSSVLSLTQGVLRAMLLKKLKIASLAVLVVGGVSSGALVWARGSFQSPPKAAPAGKPAATTDVGGAAIDPAPGGFPPGKIPAFVANAARFKNTPNMADLRDPINVFGTASIIVVESPDASALDARCVDDDDKRWRRLAIPAGLRVTPVAVDDTLALAYEGKSIDRISAFSAHTGEWSTVQLAEPVQEAITPAIGHGCALYQAGDTFYAFSAGKGAWDVLRLPVDDKVKAKARASISERHIKVQQGDRLYVFGLQPGKWSEGVTIKLQPATKAASPQSAPGSR